MKENNQDNKNNEYEDNDELMKTQESGQNARLLFG